MPDILGIVDKIMPYGKIGEMILNGIKHVATLPDQQRESLASLLAAVSDCLERCVEVMRKDQVPYGECGQLRFFAHELPPLLDTVFPQAQARDLGQQLIDASDIERVAAAMGDQGILASSPLGKQALARLLDAAGQFKAAATYLKAI